MPHKNKVLSGVFRSLCKNLDIKGVKLRIQKSHVAHGRRFGGCYWGAKNLIILAEHADNNWNIFALLHEFRHAIQYKKLGNMYASATGELEWDADQWALKTYKLIFGDANPWFFDAHVIQQKGIYKRRYRKPKKSWYTKFPFNKKGIIDNWLLAVAIAGSPKKRREKYEKLLAESQKKNDKRRTIHSRKHVCRSYQRIRSL